MQSLALECYFLFNYIPYHHPAHEWVPVLPSLEEMGPLLVSLRSSMCLHALPDVPAAGSGARWMQERWQRTQLQEIAKKAIKCAPQGKWRGRAGRMHLACMAQRGGLYLGNQEYPTCGSSVEWGVGAFQPHFWSRSINSWLTIYSLLLALCSSQKVFSQQTFNLCCPPPFAAGEAIINNDSGFSGHHLQFPAACSDFNL